MCIIHEVMGEKAILKKIIQISNFLEMIQIKEWHPLSNGLWIAVLTDFLSS